MCRLSKNGCQVTQQLSALCLDHNLHSLRVLMLMFRKQFHACLRSQNIFQPAGCSMLTHMIRHAPSFALVSARAKELYEPAPVSPRSSPFCYVCRLHSSRDITNTAPPSTLPQGGVRQQLKGRREGIWKDLRVDSREINRQKTQDKK